MIYLSGYEKAHAEDISFQFLKGPEEQLALDTSWNKIKSPPRVQL